MDEAQTDEDENSKFDHEIERDGQDDGESLRFQNLAAKVSKCLINQFAQITCLLCLFINWMFQGFGHFQ